MRRPTGEHADVVASWSGGIDSTGVAAHLLLNGYRVRLVTLRIYGGDFGDREWAARETLLPVLRGMGDLVSHVEVKAPWIWAFSPDGVEIPRRNKHIIDHLLTVHCMPRGIKNVGMGEYIGADSWLVRDHVGASDADHRSLASYVFTEYGLDYRLLSLADFGESRYKVNRVRLLVDALGEKAASLTSNCLHDYIEHCGACYKCIERAAAFDLLESADHTTYLSDPREHEAYSLYRAQMVGQNVVLPWGAITPGENVKMPVPALQEER